MEQTFYEALLAAKLRSSEDLIREYRRLALLSHPDKSGGSHEAMACLSRAYRLVTQENAQKHVLGGKGQQEDGVLKCEMCGQTIPISEESLKAGFSEFECAACGYVLYLNG